MDSEWLVSSGGSFLGDVRLDRSMSASVSSRNGSDPFLFFEWWREWCDAVLMDADVEFTAAGGMLVGSIAADGSDAAMAVCDRAT